MDFDEAWRIAGDPRADRTEALGILARNKAELLGSVFVYVPAGDEARTSQWAFIMRAASRRLCECGRRRLIIPPRPRLEIQPAGELITVSEGEPLVIGPWGGDYKSALLLLMVQDDQFTSQTDPFAADPICNFFLTKRLTGGQFWSLAGLAEGRVNHGKGDFGYNFGDLPMAIGRILAVNVAERTFTVQLDAGVQRITADTPNEEHVCW